MIDVRQADIVLSRSDSFISRTIRRFTRGHGEAPSETSHEQIVAESGPFDEVDLIESTYRARRISAGKALAACEFAIWRYRRMDRTLLTPEMCAEVVRHAGTFVGQTYPWYQLALFWVDNALARKLARRDIYLARALFKDKKVVCSGLGNVAFALALPSDHFIFGQQRTMMEDLSPDDHEDYLMLFGLKVWPIDGVSGYGTWQQLVNGRS